MNTTLLDAPRAAVHTAARGEPADLIRVLVTGGRTWTLEPPIRVGLASVIAVHGPDRIVVVHGACPRGADAITDRLATAWGGGLTVERHPAHWDHCAPTCPPAPHRVAKRVGDIDHPGLLDTYCPGAGPRRNVHMVNLGAHVLLAFPSPRSRGTLQTIRLASDAGIPVRQWTP